jgi:hypothetical protein
VKTKKRADVPPSFRGCRLGTWILINYEYFVGLDSANYRYNTRHSSEIKEELRMNRPTGVTVIAILYFIGTLFCVMAGIGMLVGGGFLATMMSQQAQGGGVATILGGLGAVLGVVCLIFAAIDAVVGWGLWALKAWARIVAIVFSAIAALLQLPGFLRLLSHFNPIALVWTLCILAIHVVIIWYLLQPQVKAAFR